MQRNPRYTDFHDRTMAQRKAALKKHQMAGRKKRNDVIMYWRRNATAVEIISMNNFKSPKATLEAKLHPLSSKECFRYETV